MSYQNKDNKTIRKENLVVSGILGITVLSGAFLALPSALADDVVDTITITVPTSCSISSTGENSYTAEIANGQHDSAIGGTTIKAYCNDNEGFAIYAIGYTDNELGKNVLTNSTLGSTHDIVTGTAITGNTSQWAMKLSKLTGSEIHYPIIIAGSSEDSLKQTGDPDFSNFTNVPDDYKKVAYRTASTDINPVGQQTAEGSTLKTTYQAYISPTQVAGEYTGQVKYTMLHPHTEPAPYTGEKTASGKICYYANASDSEGTMGCQTISDYAKDWSQCVKGTDYSSYCFNSGYSDIISSLPSTNSASIPFLASNFSREGYGFAGWSDKFDYATNNEAKFYGPNETITIPDTSIYSGEGKGLSLYAVWVKSQGSLQDSTKVASVCSELDTAPTDGTASLSSVSALSDARDNNTYAIAKLADGKCWMIENLRLDNTAEHNSDGTLAQGYHSSFAGLANAESANFSNSTTANGLYSTDGSTTKTIDSTGGNLGYRFPRYNNLNTLNRAQNEPNSNTFTNDGTTPGMYSYGNYYTWHAAIADTTHNGTNNTSSDATSICPKGWRLPIGGQNTVTSGQNGDFYVLTTTISGTIPNNANSGYAYYSGTVEGVDVGKLASDSLRGYPNNFLYSGYFYSSSAYNRGGYGYYWSSTASDSSSSYYLYLYGSYVYPGTGSYDKYVGFSIRCVSGS